MDDPQQLITNIGSALKELLPPTQEKTSDGRVIELLNMGHALMRLTGRQLDMPNPDFEVVENLRKPARQVVKMLLERADWLNAETKRHLQGFLDAYPAELKVGPYIFTADWFSHKCETQWRINLEQFKGKPDLHFLEIGSYEGRASVWLLDNILTHPTSRLTCIDPFHREYGQRFDANIERSGAAERVTKISALSSVGLKTIKGPCFDFAYIDGDHSAAHVLEDAVLTWPLVRTGGLITFDDLAVPSVQQAWSAFNSVMANCLKIVDESSQLTIRKMAEPTGTPTEAYTVS